MLRYATNYAGRNLLLDRNVVNEYQIGEFMENSCRVHIRGGRISSPVYDGATATASTAIELTQAHELSMRQ